MYSTLCAYHHHHQFPQNLRGRTPLFTACCSSNVRAVEMLLAAGADPGIATKLDFNCLHISCREGFAGFV